MRLLWPLSKVGVGFGWIAWNDLVPTLLLYGGTALAVVWPGPAVAGATLALLGLYLAWRAFCEPGWKGWEGWLSGGWVRRSPRFCRWLMGDFIP